jgi:hypothetical protein
MEPHHFWQLPGENDEAYHGFLCGFPKNCVANMTGFRSESEAIENGMASTTVRLLKYPRWTNWQWSCWKQSIKISWQIFSDDILRFCFQLNAENGLFLW